MLNDEQLEDLKQFIDSRISQLETRFDNKLDEKIEALRQEMLDGFAEVGGTVEEINKQVDERLTKLEQQAS